ncbi:MAG: cofactor-independent phosphoglycerate mutase [Candidatus Hydrogenedentes bacterium]|nr:cofactor-independent phosphoglycerate mutase [Candidatus Hydrogenedentota bacterium]
MKYIILLGDGMADWPLPEYGDRTPLEVARTPAIDTVVRLGMIGQFCPIPEGLPAGSDVGNLSMFGYDPRAAFTGRAPIEAANQGIALAADEVAFRCNLVNIEQARMRDFTAGHIETEEARPLIAALNAAYREQFPEVRFYPGVSYRHLAVVKATETVSLDSLRRIQAEPPHNITDREVAAYLPSGAGSDWIRAMMDQSVGVLAEAPENSARQAAGKLPATSIWLWGQGTAPEVEPYRTKFGLTGAVISAVDLVMGIGVCAGLEVVRVPGATGWIDTNYEGKVQAGLDALQRHDFVYIHLEAPDETAHQGRADLKIQAIEDFDARIVAPCLNYLAQHPDTRILVAPDHYTTIQTKTHAGGPVPFALCGAGVPADGHGRYSERESRESDILIEQGYTLIESFLNPAPLDIGAVAAP